MYENDFTSWNQKIHYLKDYRNDPYALDLIKQVGASVDQVTLSKKYFAELQLGEELASMDEAPQADQ